MTDADMTVLSNGCLWRHQHIQALHLQLGEEREIEQEREALSLMVECPGRLTTVGAQLSGWLKQPYKLSKKKKKRF